MTSGKGIWLATAILLSVVLTAQTKTQTQTKQSAEACSIPQSPRNIQAYPFPGGLYDGKRPDSFVTDVDGAKTIKYKGQTLLRCDQHYHVPVENTQGCPNERSGTPPHDGPPPPDQWVEIHTVYSPQIKDAPECKDPVDQNLSCCLGEPKVVRGFSAKVENTPGLKSGSGQKPGEGPINPANGRPLAEWTGSNTGGPVDCPGPCKDVQAEWSSLLTCEITVTQHQLEQLGHAHAARCPQLPPRLSDDLFLVGTPPPAPGSCHLHKAPTIIDTDARAHTVCPVVCRSSAKSWDGQWITWDDKSECGCCTSSGR